MLQKRTNILFEKEVFQKLERIASKEGISIGELVRRAVKKTYLEEDVKNKRQAIFEEILKIRPQAVKGKINYKELINYGRKY